MASLRVSLLRYVKVVGKEGWRRYRLDDKPKWERSRWDALSSFGADCAELGSFQLRWYIEGVAQYRPVGDDFADAKAQRDSLESTLELEQDAKEQGRKLVPVDPLRKMISDEIDRFVKLKKAKKCDAETISAYQNLVREFRAVTGKKYVDQITPDDMATFCSALRDRKLSERTVSNYANSILAFLRWVKLTAETIAECKDVIPKVEDPSPVAYSPEQINKLFSVITNERHLLFFQTLLMTGLREKEAAFLTWENLYLDKGVIKVLPTDSVIKVIDGVEREIIFKSKGHKERLVAVHEDLLVQLRRWRMQNPNSEYVFGTPKWGVRTTGDLPDGHMLDALKRYAHTAELNCGKCAQCRKTKGKLCNFWKLHRFRHSYATWQLHDGTDVGTVRDQLGHRDLTMTNKYLGVNENVRKAINRAPSFSGIA